MTVSAEEIGKLIDRFVDEFADTYREGIFLMKGRGGYLRGRVKEVCRRTACIMVGQVRSGRVRAIYLKKGSDGGQMRSSLLSVSISEKRAKF